MRKCHDLAGGGFRPWPAISAADLRRKLLDALSCGISHHHRSRRKKKKKNLPLYKPPQNRGSDRLSELLKLDISDTSSESDPEPETKTSNIEELQNVVKELQSQSEDRMKSAAAEVRRLAKDDAEARGTFAILGAIPPLVAMIDSDDIDSQISSLYALLNLGIGNKMNKADIVKNGAVRKMMKLIRSDEIAPSISEAIVANFLGLSALDSNKPLIGSSPGAVPFLITTFLSSSSSSFSKQSRQDSLRAIFNLSLSPLNSHHLLESDIITVLLSSIGDMEVSERSLAILSNLISGTEARECIIRNRDSLPILIDALGWTDSPNCQEHAAYILMVVAHKSSASDRNAMIGAGIRSALLELALVGRTLAQKRASRILEMLRVDKGKQVSEGFETACLGLPGVSAPQEKSGGETVRDLVNESLRGNMRRIIRRANMQADDEFVAGAVAAMATSSSKSLPF